MRQPKTEADVSETVLIDNARPLSGPHRPLRPHGRPIRDSLLAKQLLVGHEPRRAIHVPALPPQPVRLDSALHTGNRRNPAISDTRRQHAQTIVQAPQFVGSRIAHAVTLGLSRPSATPNSMYAVRARAARASNALPAYRTSDITSRRSNNPRFTSRSRRFSCTPSARATSPRVNRIQPARLRPFVLHIHARVSSQGHFGRHFSLTMSRRTHDWTTRNEYRTCRIDPTGLIARLSRASPLRVSSLLVA